MVDITPTPRVLRTLGQIPFAPWQCLAELIDNSIDGFLRADREGIALAARRIVVSWPNANAADAQIEIADTGPGMLVDQLTKCVRAGYSENDPINNLGLFGMGFNIATARMGDRTLILSATQEASEWSGIEIDFSSLVGQENFDAPARNEPKKKPSEHGTKIIISKLEPGSFAELKGNASRLRRMLEEVYTPILEELNLEILIQGKLLSPRPHCVWSQTRYVVHKRQNVPAIIEIDETLGESLFDTLRNRYLTANEEDDALQSESLGNGLPEGVVRRQKKICGWLGIQRYADPSDFGIDFVRNGRKILVRDKSIFEFYNPITLKTETEYPVELGATVGGRIVGQISVDHIPPTYQKNDFHRTDPSWQELVDTLRGDGPILPKRRKAMGYEGDNVSPIGRLMNAYRRVDAGTKCLAAPTALAREFAEKFGSGHPEFLSDDKWWHAAVEQDRIKADRGSKTSTAVDVGDAPSDKVEGYLDGSGGKTSNSGPIIKPVPEPDPLENLRSRSTKVESLSRDYSYPGCASPLRVIVYRVDQGIIGEGDQGIPCELYRSGNECEFFFNPLHPFLASYPITPMDLLLVYLSERIKVRDNASDRDIAVLFSDLMKTNFQDRQLDLTSLQEKSRQFLDRIREFVNAELGIRESEIVDCIHESAGEVEETASAISMNPVLLSKFQSKTHGSLDAVQFVPYRTLIRLIDRFPEEFFDHKFFRGLYSEISLPEQQASDRLRAQVKERALTLLKDVVGVLSDTMMIGHAESPKEDLQRIAHSIDALNGELAE